MKVLLLQILLYIIGCYGDGLVFPDYTVHPCKRTCPDYINAKTCYYKFTAELIYSMEPNCLGCPNFELDCYAKGCVVADGTARLIYTINRMVPGPVIEVCQGDRIIVDVVNQMEDMSTSIHWHGIHQKKSQWMDGVPFITQCPIPPQTTFRYDFIANEIGTHFYHSHSGFQRSNGMAGALVVHLPQKYEPNGLLYDKDLSQHIIIFNDWFKYEPSTFYYDWYRMRNFDANVVSTILINGFGSSATNNLPYQRFYVTKGLRYRFRFISNAIESCPTQITIDNHRFSVISSDGADIIKLDVESVILTSGERYDIVITANQTVGAYWIRFTGFQSCNELQSLAILQYNGITSNQSLPQANAVSTTTPIGTSLNCFYVPGPMTNCISIAQMKSVSAMAQNLKGIPDVKLYMGLEFLNFARKVDQGVDDDKLLTHTINRISFISPSTPLLQDPTQKFCNPQNTYCNGMCECMQGYEIPYHSLVEIILINVGDTYDDITHPIHLHGHLAAVIGEGRFPNQNVTIDYIRNKDTQNLLPRNLINAPYKDTFPIGNFEYLILRFRADNPGMWFVHCHTELHMDAGMNFVIKTGQNYEMPSLPYNFPRCGNYLGTNSMMDCMSIPETCT